MNSLHLIDNLEIRHVASGRAVGAQLLPPPSNRQIYEASREWSEMLKYVKKAGNMDMQEWQGDWETIAEELKTYETRLIGLAIHQKLEGLMRMSFKPAIGHDTWRKQLIEIDFLETAPWNIRSYMHSINQTQVYCEVGRKLVEVASALSLNMGEEGQLQLKAVTGAERFYVQLGFRTISNDALDGLPIMKLNIESALHLLEGVV